MNNTLKSKRHIEYANLLKQKEQEIITYCLNPKTIEKYQQLFIQAHNSKKPPDDLIANSLYDFKCFTKQTDDTNCYFYHIEALASFISLLKTNNIQAYITFHWNKINIDDINYSRLSPKEIIKYVSLNYIEAKKQKDTTSAGQIETEKDNKGNIIYKAYLGKRLNTILLGETTSLEEAQKLIDKIVYNSSFCI